MKRPLLTGLLRATLLVFAAGALAAFAGCGSSQSPAGAGTQIASGKQPDSTPSGGGGSDVGNGGSVITLPDGRVVIADPYYSREQGEIHHYSDFSPAIREQIELVGRLLVRLGAAVDENIDIQFPPGIGRHERSAAEDRVRLGRKVSRAAQARFVVDSIADPVIEYHFVDRIPSVCRGGEDIGPTAAGATVVLGGCNEGDAVWFQKDVFRSMSVRDGDPNDPREQVKWIIHERLHSINFYGHPHYYIADITNGIDVLLDLHKATNLGRSPPLSVEQHSKLSLLVERIAQFRGLTPDGGRDDRFVSDWKVWMNGGGLVHKSATVDATAYVGAGSMLGSGGALGPGAKFVNTLCYLASCRLGEGAQMLDTVVSPRVSQRASSPGEQSAGAFSVSLAKNAVLRHASLYLDIPAAGAPSGVTLDDSALLENSVFSGVTSIHLAQWARFAGRLEVEVRDDAATTFELGEYSYIDGLAVSFRTKPAPSSSVREMNLPHNMELEFNGPICRPPLVPLLGQKLALDQVDSTCVPISSL